MKVRIQKTPDGFRLVHATTGDALGIPAVHSYGAAARLARRLSYVVATGQIERHFFMPCAAVPLTRVDCSSGLTFWLDGHCNAETVKRAAHDHGTFSHVAPCPRAGQVSLFSGEF